MPVMNGIEATKIIRQLESSNSNRKRTPIIAISAGVDEANRANCLEIGMDDFIPKVCFRISDLLFYLIEEKY